MAQTQAKATAIAAVAAEAAADAAPANDEDGTEVGEVVVTAGLRTAKLQDTPLAVSSVSAQEFENSGFKEPRELQFLSPSITVSQQGGNGIFIRGNGTASQNSGTEQSVGMVIDGVLMGFVDDIGGDITDLDHIEIYRGPQGTQFAKNATAGVVAVTTRRPQIGVASFDAHLAYGEHDDTNTYIRANTPISDTMAARFVASYQHRDGVFYNAARDDYQAMREQYGGKFKFVWSPKERTNVYFSVDGRRETQAPNFPQAWRVCGPQGATTSYTNVYGTKNLPPCNGALLAGITPSPTNSVIAEIDGAHRHTLAGGASVQVELPVFDFDLTSITALRGMSRDFIGPSGSGYYTNNYLNNAYAGRQFSQEVRLASPGDGKFTYVLGAFYYKRDTHTKSFNAGPAYGQAYANFPNSIYGQTIWQSTAGGSVHANSINNSYAGFADGTWHVTDRFVINAGLRLIHDEVEAKSFTVVMPGTFSSTSRGCNVATVANCIVYGTNSAGGNYTGVKKPADADSVSANGQVWRFSPQFYITPDIQLYGTVAHGYKGPLIDNSVDDFKRIEPETVEALEAGIKSAFFDRRLTVNVAIFRNEFKNLQLSVLNTTVVPNLFQLGNARGSLSKGEEIEIRGRVTDDLTLTASATVLNAKYTDYHPACWGSYLGVPQPTTGPNACYVAPGQTGLSMDATGYPTLNSSKFTYRFGANYAHTFSNGYTVDASGNYLHRSKWWSSPANPNLIDPGYGIANFSAGFGPEGGKWHMQAWVRNAFDKFFYAGLQQNNGGSTIVLNPEAVRTFGITLDFHASR